MTIQDMITKIEQINPWILLAFFLSPPIFTWIIGKCHDQGYGNYKPWNFIYSFLVYLVCVPGMFTGVLLAYSVFFIRQNLLEVNIFVYFLPLACMIITLVLVGKNADWEYLPGVDRLYALMIIIIISLSIALAIQKTRIWIFFGGTIKTLIYIVILCFILLKWSSYKLFHSKKSGFPEPGFGKDTGPGTKAGNYEKDLEELKKKLRKMSNLD